MSSMPLTGKQSPADSAGKNMNSLTQPKKPRSVWKSALADRRVLGAIVLLVSFYLIALFAPFISPADPNAQNLLARLQPPSREFLFGTDALGRDMLSRAIYAARVSLGLSLLTMLITIVIGSLVGLLAGFLGGWVDTFLMRMTDVFLAFPVFILLITLVAIYGTSLPLLILFLGLSSWPVTARTVRAEVLSIRKRDYIEAARVVGANTTKIVLRHVLPNVASVIIVAGTLRVATVILIEASLSYFGLGVQPPTPTWGNMVSDGRLYLDTAWWITAIPGTLVVITVLAYNILGEGLRDSLDPRRR